MKQNLLRVLNLSVFLVLMTLMMGWVVGDTPVKSSPEQLFDIWILGPITVLGWAFSSLLVWVDRLITLKHPDV